MERLVLLILLVLVIVVGVGLCSNLGIGVEPGPGDRAVAPLGQGDCPSSHPVKATLNRNYYIPGTHTYEQAVAQRCYATAGDAEAAGYRSRTR